MHQIKSEYRDYQARRLMRPDWRRYVRPNSELAAFYERIERKYRPDQSRVPAGSPEGGQWTNGNPEGEEQTRDYEDDARVQIAQIITGSLTDAPSLPYYRPGGHHEVPRALYENWNLNAETESVFRQATTGKVPSVIRTTPDGIPQGNIWDEAHRQYSDAVEKLARRLVDRHGIELEQMSPDHARELLMEVRESQDPRIRDFNRMIRFIQRLYRLRIGRGAE